MSIKPMRVLKNK